MTKFITGVILGAVLVVVVGAAIDYMLFGTIKPCETVQRFEDGSSIINCSVKE
jgi:hypothetical protein